MTAIQVVIGVLCLAVGATLVVARGRLVARHARHGRTEVPATGWAVLGIILVLLGALQALLALT